jgi:effector-binding domain-containing protein
MEPAVQEMPAQPVAACRARVPVAGLREFFDRAYPLVVSALAAQGVAPAGPPFGAYRDMSGGEVEVEAGFPVAGPVADAGEVRGGTLPACRAAVAVHVGPYEDLGAAWGELRAWVEREGLHPAGGVVWEVYESDPGAEPDPSGWRTRLVQPVG